jgi:hypothetical protein
MTDDVDEILTPGPDDEPDEGTIEDEDEDEDDDGH